MKNESAFPEYKKAGVCSSMKGGLTIRDYFAAKIVQALISNSNIRAVSDDKLASSAYQMADAMIAEREKENNKC